MNAPVILDFDQSVGSLERATKISLADWQEDIRFGCSKEKYNQLKQYLDKCLPEAYGTVLMGSGDYHHISLLLIERLAAQYAETPIEVVIFDNHPDNMRYLFGIHCGSWVSYVANLPFVKHVHVVGITSNDIGLAHSWENRLKPLFNNKLTYWSMDVNVNWAKHIGLGKAFRSFPNPDELMIGFLSYLYQSSSPIYLSIDKDVLSEESVKTNWDQGRLQPYHILDTISALNNRIIGSDITGDISIWNYQSRLKRFLSSLDEQPPITEDVLKAWQLEQNKVNVQFIDAIAKNN